MGTNYYAHLEYCDKCGRADIHHIGKSSAGWTFSFHAIDNFLTLTISSWKDWQSILGEPTTKIFDEYGDSITFEAFRELVEKKKGEKYNHAKECRDGNSEIMGPYCSAQGQFLDDEGNSFSEGKFS